MSRPIRLAVRAILLHEGRLCMVNAWPKGSDLLCAPGGGAEVHQSLPENLAREVYEETGLRISVGAPCLVNEFHDPKTSYHQAEVFFRTTLDSGDPFGPWSDPEGVVKDRYWLTRAELEAKKFRPCALPTVAWKDPGAPVYDPLEAIIF